MIGLLKVGEKRLFVYDMHGENHEMTPLCILDFYITEVNQRKGYGRMLFDCMLRMENTTPEYLAIDYPSEKSIKFLKKQYNLKNPSHQGNNYVIFDGFFNNRSSYNRKNNSTLNGGSVYLNHYNTGTGNKIIPKELPKVQIQRTSSVGAFETRFSSANTDNLEQDIGINNNRKLNGINPNMNHLMNQQQMIQNKTQQLQLQTQQTHLEFTNNRIGSTFSTSSLSGSANRAPTLISKLKDNNELLSRDNSSANSFKSTSLTGKCKIPFLMN